MVSLVNPRLVAISGQAVFLGSFHWKPFPETLPGTGSLFLKPGTSATGSLGPCKEKIHAVSEGAQSFGSSHHYQITVKRSLHKRTYFSAIHCMACFIMRIDLKWAKIKEEENAFFPITTGWKGVCSATILSVKEEMDDSACNSSSVAFCRCCSKPHVTQPCLSDLALGHFRKKIKISCKF